MTEKGYDHETSKADETHAIDLERNSSADDNDNGHAVPGQSFGINSGFHATAQRLASKLKIEQRGIERVPEDERTDSGFKALLNVATMWLSANMVVSSFALGLLARSLFSMGVGDAMLVILFFNLLGITPVCFFSTFGPAFGL